MTAVHRVFMPRRDLGEGRMESLVAMGWTCLLYAPGEWTVPRPEMLARGYGIFCYAEPASPASPRRWVCEAGELWRPADRGALDLALLTVVDEASLDEAIAHARSRPGAPWPEEVWMTDRLRPVRPPWPKEEEEKGE